MPFSDLEVYQEYDIAPSASWCFSSFGETLLSVEVKV